MEKRTSRGKRLDGNLTTKIDVETDNVSDPNNDEL